MKTYDFEHLEDKVLHQEIDKRVNQSETDFKGIVDYDPLFMYQIVNKCYSMKDLLLAAGVKVRSPNMYCPFHDDEFTGKQSAKFFYDDDTMYCFSENKSYTAYHVLKYIYGLDMKKKFLEAWKGLSEHEREILMRDYGGDSEVSRTDFISEVWRKCVLILSKFKKGEVTFKQHKNALYKIFKMIHEDNNKKRLEA